MSKKVITLIALIGVIIVCVVSLFVTTGINNTPTLFDGADKQTIQSGSTNVEVTKDKAQTVSADDLGAFDINFFCSEYNEATKVDDKTKAGTLKFKFALYNKKTTYKVENLKLTLNVGTSWAYGHEVFSASKSNPEIKSVTDKTNLKETDYTTLNITSFTEVFPVRTLGLIKVKSPTAYLLIEWDETNSITGYSKSYRKIVQYSYSDYFIDGQTKGGLSNY